MIRKDTNEIIFSRDEIEDMISSYIARNKESSDIVIGNKDISFDFIEGNKHNINFNVVQIILKDKAK